MCGLVSNIVVHVDHSEGSDYMQQFLGQWVMT